MNFPSAGTSSIVLQLANRGRLTTSTLLKRPQSPLRIESCAREVWTEFLVLVDTQKIVRCHAADTKRRVLGRDLHRSGPGLGTRHRGGRTL